MRPRTTQFWKVQLGQNHPTFTEIQFKRRLYFDSDYTAVVVDSKKFIACYAREIPCYVIPPIAQWEDGKEEGLRRFLNPEAGIPEMPVVGFNVKKRLKSSAKGINSFVKEGVVSFVNGRHRSVYMTHYGAASFPVEVIKSEARYLKEYCGLI